MICPRIRTVSVLNAYLSTLSPKKEKCQSESCPTEHLLSTVVYYCKYWLRNWEIVVSMLIYQNEMFLVLVRGYVRIFIVLFKIGKSFDFNAKKKKKCGKGGICNRIRVWVLFVLLTDNRFQVSCIAVDDPLQSRVEVYMYGGTEQDITSMTSYCFLLFVILPKF